MNLNPGLNINLILAGLNINFNIDSNDSNNSDKWTLFKNRRIYFIY